MSKWATSQDCERLRQEYPWINSRERGYISPEKSDPEFMPESFEDRYMSWQEAEVDRWYNCYSDSDYEWQEITLGLTLKLIDSAENPNREKVPPSGGIIPPGHLPVLPVSEARNDAPGQVQSNIVVPV